MLGNDRDQGVTVMALRSELIRLGLSLSTINRSVYDVNSDPDFRIQKGYITYYDKFIPVWRPYDPQDISENAFWRSRVWKNIYEIRMNTCVNGRKIIKGKIEKYIINDKSIALPQVEIEISNELIRFIESNS
jgi:hypothetical protein